MLNSSLPESNEPPGSTEKQSKPDLLGLELAVLVDLLLLHVYDQRLPDAPGQLRDARAAALEVGHRRLHLRAEAPRLAHEVVQVGLGSDPVQLQRDSRGFEAAEPSEGSRGLREESKQRLPGA
jgi:hypothetical protein